MIFDLDGTLLNTLPDLADAVNYGLRIVGLPPASDPEVRSWVGEGLPTLCRRAMRGAPGVSLDELQAAVTTYYAEHRLDKTAPYPGIPELLDELTLRGLPLGVLSNKPHLHTAPIVEAYFARWSFAAVMGYTQEDRRKPDPRTSIEIAAAMRLPPGEVALLGDSDTDMLTARNAGLIPLGATWGYRDRDVVAAAGARHLIDRPSDVLKLLD